MGCRLAEIDKGWGQCVAKATNGIWSDCSSQCTLGPVVLGPNTLRVTTSRRRNPCALAVCLGTPCGENCGEKTKSTRRRLIYLTLWRTEGDSNPRYALNVYTLSRRAPSTTRPPVRCASFLNLLRKTTARYSNITGPATTSAGHTGQSCRPQGLLFGQERGALRS